MSLTMYFKRRLPQKCESDPTCGRILPETVRPLGRRPVQLAALLALAHICGCSRAADHPEIRALLGAQVEAWNAGDIDGFMRGYWKSDELTFSTPSKTVHGWQATLDRYKARYATRRQMGRLKFDRLVVTATGPDTAEASGRYRLDTADGPRSGRFYLHLRRIDGQWVIVKDHTVEDKPPS